MRIKNFTLLLLMGVFGLFSFTAQAQQDATIDPADIRYWIGEGESEAVFIVNWAEPDTALAWGYRFNGESVIVKDMMLEIAATDPRFGFVGESFVNDVTFNDGVLNLALAGMWWMYNVNGQTAGEYFDAQTVVNGDVVKFGDESCGIMTDPLNYYYIWTKEVAAVYPYAEETMIDPADIRYWVGEGDSEAIFAVNWAEPNVCYAWGYRFSSTETVYVKDMMDAIAAADNRFGYQGGGGMVYDITYDYGEEHLALVGDYWMYNLNGGMAWYGYDQQLIGNGDFVKFGDIACAIEVAQWAYVWDTAVTAVYPYAEDATIAPADITYWVGEGDSEVIFAVNWAEPNVCYAWGYRFVGESVTVKDVMDVIAAVDHRFAYEVGGWGVTNITFDYNDIHLALVGDYWMYNINGVGAGLGYDAQPVTNGDFIKWGDIACATEVAEWSYVWETPVVPVVNNTSVGENVTSLALYPNPATSYAMLEVSEMSDATVTVTDLQGRVLNSFAVAQTNEPIRIETAGYQAGIYFVTISDATSRQTVKLSVK